MKKILIYTAMWQRPEIASLFSKGIKRFIDAASDGVECSVFAVVTGKESVALCQKNKFEFFVHDNLPLGKKWNRGLEYALAMFDFDYVLIMGDDDLVHPRAWYYYMQAIEQRIPYFGFRNLYFYCSQTHQAVSFDYQKFGLDKNKLIGCGRMISREAIEKSGFQQKVMMLKDVQLGHEMILSTYRQYTLPLHKALFLDGMNKLKFIGDKFFSLWSNSQNTGLDFFADMSLLANGITPFALENGDDIVLVDIKSDKNIWKFEKYVSSSSKVTASKVRKLFPELNLLKSISQLVN